MEPAIRTNVPKLGADVQVWTAEVSALDDPRHYARCWDVLSPAEQSHAGRFRFEQDRRSYVASHSLRRHVLSDHAPVDPKQWQFIADDFGRPRIAFPVLDESLEFNCSKTVDLVVCAVTSGAAVGIDIERTDRRVPASVAEAAFAPGERAAMKALPLEEQGRRFFTLWTLKEAYLKARGVGLTVPMDSVTFLVTASPGAAAEMTFSAADDCGEWQFTLLFPSPSHVASVCVRRQPGADRRVDMRCFSKADV